MTFLNDRKITDFCLSLWNGPTTEASWCFRVRKLWWSRLYCSIGWALFARQIQAATPQRKEIDQSNLERLWNGKSKIGKLKQDLVWKLKAFNFAYKWDAF